MSTTPQSASDASPLVPLSRSKLILSMTILYLLFASDLWARVGINALLPVLQKDLQLTDIQIGMLGSAVLIGMISFVLPASYLADKWSRRGTVCLMGLTWSIGTILCGLVPSMAMLVLGRFLVGGGNSSYAPASVAMLTNWFPKKSWGKVIGLYNTSYQIGISGGLIVTGYLADAYGWRMSFLIIGIPSLILALTALLIPAGPAKTAATIAKAPRVSIREALSVILKNRTLMSTALATTFFNITTASFLMFTPIYFIREMDMDVAKAASILGLMGLTGFAAMPLGGLILDVWYKRDMRCRGWFPAICLLLTAILFCAGYAGKSLLFMTLGCFTINMVPTCYHVITQEVVPARYKASSYGSLVIFLQLGGTIGSTLTGILSHSFGIQQALVWIQLSLVLSACCFLAAGLCYRQDFARAQER